MSKKIKVDLYLDGAKQFNSDLRNINASLKQFQSELKQNATQFKDSQNSMQALSQKSESLNKAYETAGQKVELYAKRLEELSKARQQEQDKYAQYQSALDAESRKLAEIEQTSGKSSEAYQKQAAVVEQLKGKLEATGAAISRFDTEEIKLNTSLNNATTEQLKYGSELEKTNGYLAEAEKSTDGYAQSIDKYGREVDTASENTKKMSDALEAMAESEAFERISEGAKKLLENMIECAEVAEQFEYSVAKVQSIAQVSGDSLKGMSQGIREISTGMGIGANEVAEATYQALSASVDASEAVGFVADTAKLSRAGFTELTTAVDVVTTAINAYGKEANTAAHISDNLITTQNLGKTTVDELAQSMGTIIPTASAYGVSLDQLSTGYVILTKQGINTANATTYLRGMLNELGDAGSDVADILKAQTGMSFGQLMKQGYTLGDIMQLLGDYCHGDSEAFANLFGNIRAGQGALAIFNQGAEAFNETL
ncbi:MAG: phage tail tape measure protein, partial [Mogibacterium sp.]|nr:phage tail tape measure protein [Mogibacterium sp.]